MNKKILHRDGKALAVIRPSDPSLALQLAHLAMKTQDKNLFGEMLTKQDYTFAGYASSDGSINLLDENGSLVDTMRPGDSLIEADAFTAPEKV